MTRPADGQLGPRVEGPPANNQKGSMSDFEVFSRDLAPLNSQPLVTVQKRGAISLNRAAHVALRSAVAVELLFDREQRIIGLRPVAPRAAHAYPLRPATSSPSGPFVISAMAFLRHYEVDTTVSRRWVAYFDDGMLCVNLCDDSTVVTSNRARRDP